MSRDIRGKHTHRQLHVRCVSRAQEGGANDSLVSREEERTEGRGKVLLQAFEKKNLRAIVSICFSSFSSPRHRISLD